jgi:PAS domain S-box-containing protein
MTLDEPPRGSRLDGEIRLVIVDSPDLAAPLVGALDAAAVGGWVWVPGDGALYFSPRVLDILGLGLEPRHTLISRYLDAVHAADRAAVREVIECRAPAGPFVLRYRFHRGDGTERWIEDRGRVERDPSGHLIRQGGAIRDVTADVAAEEQRAEASAWLEALINAMPFGVWGRDSAMRVNHQNPVSIGWWGDLRGSELQDVPPDVSRSWRTIINAALGGRTMRRRQRYTLPHGTHVFDETVAPVRVGGEVAGVVGVSIDVTDEQRQRDFEAVLTELSTDFVSRSGEKLEGAVPAALERIGKLMGVSIAALCEITDDRLIVTHWWIDPATGVTQPYATEFETSQLADFAERLRANEAIILSERDELPPDSIGARLIAARHVNSLALVPARRTKRGLKLLGVAAIGDRIIDWPHETETMLRLAGALLSGVVERLESEQEQKAVDRRMQETQKLESLGALAGGVAHDFNNLLTAILGNASLAKSELALDSPVQESLTQIEAASHRAAEMCRQMLAYAGRGRVAPLPVQLTELVRESEQLLRVSVPKKILVQLHLADRLPLVMADSRQIQQVLMSLVSNAAEAIGSDEGRIRVETSSVCLTAADLRHAVLGDDLEPGEYVRLAVTDWGAGILPETLPRIFEPFFTTRFAGRGLGLAAVAGIVRAHHAALLVETEPGKGSTFTMLLAAHQSSALHSTKPAPLPDDASLATYRTTGLALVVDDEAGVRNLVRAVLERAGLTVIQAEDGRAGLESFRGHASQLRLVVLDLTMPGLDGAEALQAMREIRPDVPAILMSGYVQAVITAPATEAFLQKPFTPAALRAAVWRAIH